MTRRGDRLVPLDERLDTLEREVIVLRWVVIATAALHVAALPQVMGGAEQLARLFGMVVIR